MKEKRIIFSMLWRSLFVQAIWNFERLQNIGFAFGLLPLLKTLYPDREKRKEALIRHTGFFNTHPYMANIIFGLVATMEEDKVNGGPITDDEIVVLKHNMAGPLAAIGDTFFWATWRPFVAILTTGLILIFFRYRSFYGTWFAPVVFLTVYNILNVPFRYWSLLVSYHQRSRVIDLIAELEFQFAVDMVRLAGFIVLLIVVALYFWLFSANMFETASYILAILVAMVMGCLRLSPALIFYAVILLSIGLVWLRSY
jgi:PTS system mannose-specific IID component